MKMSWILASALVAATPGMAWAGEAPAGNAAVGQKLFIQCRACHTVDGTAAHTIGPNLNGVVGARAGARKGYTYSQAMAASGLVWNAKTLDRFLTRPSTAVPGTKMAFAGIAAPKARADMIAYLATLKPSRR